MSYLDQSRKTSPTSMVAVVAIHAAVGVALITGLTVSGVIEAPDGPVTAITPYTPPPPPIPDPVVEPPKAAPDTSPPLNVPIPRLDINKVEPRQPTTDIIIPYVQPPIQPGTGAGIEKAIPEPVPSGFDPVGAKPRNDPARWLSDNDYRPLWVRQEMTGRARFRLEIAANGKVTGCEVTGSTGHAALDEATCDLITRRAKFEPARDRDGEATGGVYNGAVEWRLPR